MTEDAQKAGQIEGIVIPCSFQSYWNRLTNHIQSKTRFILGTRWSMSRRSLNSKITISIIHM